MQTNLKITKWQTVSVCLLALSAVLITVAGIVFRQTPLRIAPLYVSLVIGFLQSNASRYAYLLGAFNCFLYSASWTLRNGTEHAPYFASVASGNLLDMEQEKL